MAQVRRAVITAAGRGTRHFPATRLFQKEMMPLVDRDGTTRPTIQIIVEEAVEAGIEEVCIVVSPDHREQIRRHFLGFDAEQREAFAGKRWAEAEAEKLARLGDRVTFAVQGCATRPGKGGLVVQGRQVPQLRDRQRDLLQFLV